ncbi:AAA family ATPase [Aliarcobacter lanthieri]|uniref:AAA family ATPase n=1 Tax=Aliarcobacter lanthieri TaxID=1355374 RepID=UPI003AAA28B3
MELVYLWVEEYRNINRQGFNFSSKFKCKFKDEYDENNKLKNNCELSIEENNNFINIFPDNINITAIVGENGSGKSNLINCLGDRLVMNKKIIYFMDETIFTNLNSINNKTKYKIKKISDIIDNIIFLDKNFLLTIPNRSLFSIFHLKNNNLYLKYFDFDKYKLTLNMNSFFKNIFKNILFKNYSKNEFFNPTKIKIYFNSFYREYIGSTIQKTINNNSQEFKYQYLIYLKSLEIVEETSNIIDISELKTLQTGKMKDFLDNTNNKLDYNYPKYDDNNLTLNRNEKIFGFLNNFFVNDNKLEDKVFLFESNEKLDFFNTEENIEIFLYLTKIGFLEYDFLDSKKLFSTLSNGEKSFFIDMLILNEKIKEFLEDKDKDNNHSLFLVLDEPETTFHPQWQKNYINEIINFLKNFKKIKFHLIFTSHSPFILSDIPKDNVIFIKNGEQVYPFEKVQNTFGANIHTLLSHGFFMSDGLMGEFAKSKINEILEFLNDKEKLKTIKKEQIIPIIESIGEDFLKNKLLNLYYKKFGKSKELKKQILKKQIDELEKKYKELDK